MNKYLEFSAQIILRDGTRLFAENGEIRRILDGSNKLRFCCWQTITSTGLTLELDNQEIKVPEEDIKDIILTQYVDTPAGTFEGTIRMNAIHMPTKTANDCLNLLIECFEGRYCLTLNQTKKESK